MKTMKVAGSIGVTSYLLKRAGSTGIREFRRVFDLMEGGKISEE